VSSPYAQSFGAAAERAQLAATLAGLLAPRYRLPVVTDLYWTRAT
jgi:hypothetical protein